MNPMDHINDIQARMDALYELCLASAEIRDSLADKDALSMHLFAELFNDAKAALEEFSEIDPTDLSKVVALHGRVQRFKHFCGFVATSIYLGAEAEQQINESGLVPDVNPTFAERNDQEDNNDGQDDA